MKIFGSLLFLLLLVTCTTYDNALIYHKNFNSGTHPLLRFDGFYTDTLAPQTYTSLIPSQTKPVFFYSNGSAFSCDNYTVYSTRPETLKGAWGNYLIKGDSITLEKFQLINSNYQRIVLRGKISKDQIHWTSRKDHNENFKPVDYYILYSSKSPKPDSTKNFTRTKKKYNQ